MKNLVYGLMFLVGLTVSSCNNDDDGYSLDDYVITAATYHQLDGAYYLVNDNGETLWPAASDFMYSSFEDGDRVTVNYTVLGEDPDGYYDYYVSVNGMELMLTKDMVIFDETTTQEQRDTIGSDPIEINNAWIAGDYLTLVFEMPLSYTTHLVNVVDDLALDKTDTGATILELTHNDFDAPSTGYFGWGIASFNISDLKNQAEGENSMVIALRATDEYGAKVDYATTLLYEFDGEGEVDSTLKNFKTQGTKIDLK
ncbi:MAG: hypothetical protein ACK5JS_02560 [Mangrovibacterium sp.]